MTGSDTRRCGRRGRRRNGAHCIRGLGGGRRLWSGRGTLREAGPRKSRHAEREDGGQKHVPELRHTYPDCLHSNDFSELDFDF